MMKCWRRLSIHSSDATVELPCISARVYKVPGYDSMSHQHIKKFKQDSRGNPGQLGTPSKTLYRETPSQRAKVPASLSPSKTLYRKTPIPKSKCPNQSVPKQNPSIAKHPSQEAKNKEKSTISSPPESPCHAICRGECPRCPI